MPCETDRHASIRT